MRKALLIVLAVFAMNICNAQFFNESMDDFFEVPSNNTVVHLSNGKAYVINSITFTPIISFNIGDSTVNRWAVNKKGDKLALERKGCFQVFDLNQGSLLASSNYPDSEEYQSISLTFIKDEILEAVLMSSVGNRDSLIQWNVKEATIKPWTEVHENKIYENALSYFEKKWGYPYWDTNDQWTTIEANTDKGELLTLLHFRRDGKEYYKFVRFKYDKNEIIKSHQEIAVDGLENVSLGYVTKANDKFFLKRSADTLDYFYTFDLSTLKVQSEKVVSNKDRVNYISHDGSRIYSIRGVKRNLEGLSINYPKTTPHVRVLPMDGSEIIGKYVPIQLFHRSEFFLPDKPLPATHSKSKLLAGTIATSDTTFYKEGDDFFVTANNGKVSVWDDQRKVLLSLDATGPVRMLGNNSFVCQLNRNQIVCVDMKKGNVTDIFNESVIDNKKIKIVSWDTSPHGNYLVLLFHNPTGSNSKVNVIEIGTRKIVFQRSMSDASKVQLNSVIVYGQEYDIETGWLLDTTNP